MEKWDNFILNEEQQISESGQGYDLRIYETFFIISISKELGGDMQEIQTEIRAIPGVTTVRTVGVSKDIGQRYLAKISIKFALLGATKRITYRRQTLIPKMSIIKGLQIHKVYPIERINKQGTIRRVNEKKQLKEYAINDYAQNAVPRKSSRKMPTPRNSIQNMVDDYSASGQQVYDMPVRTNNMAYHVMVPVEELMMYMPRYYRGDRMKYETSYQDFIANGPKIPVFVAIGANGRAKITGNEDIVFFAIEAGVAEVPVFFSYQRQV